MNSVSQKMPENAVWDTCGRDIRIYTVRPELNLLTDLDRQCYGEYESLKT